MIAVTGMIPLAEREQRTLELRGVNKYVLICTDCLNEGVNLQHLFDAVVHYDLSWNPTRHEQREGRVSVPVPTTSNAVLEALYEGLLLRNRDPRQILLPFEDDDELRPKTEQFNTEWQNAT